VYRGETREEAIDLGIHLQEQGITPLLVYSKESSDSDDTIRNTEDEISKCIVGAKVFQKPAFVAIKLSGLTTEEELRNVVRDLYFFGMVGPAPGTPKFAFEARRIASRHPALFERLQRLCAVARECDVQLVLDAEIRFSGRIDGLPASAILCSLLNESGPRIWNTHQMYDFSLLMLIQRIFKDSLPKLDQWAGGNPIKLVRGAYLDEEPASQVIQSKEQADEHYDEAVRTFIRSKPNSLMLATHNHSSIVRAWDLLQESDVKTAKTKRDLVFAQLYGMGEDITYGLAEARRDLPENSNVNISVAKYIPYGTLPEVMPYLVRRAQENRGMLSGSVLEREVLYTELKRRIWAFIAQRS
jgi:proline dehydrogenase